MVYIYVQPKQKTQIFFLSNKNNNEKHKNKLLINIKIQAFLKLKWGVRHQGACGTWDFTEMICDLTCESKDLWNA